MMDRPLATWLQRIARRSAAQQQEVGRRWMRSRGPEPASGLVDLSNNDYLRLSQHPHLIESVRAAAQRWGVGSGSSRLVRGTLDIHGALERRFARFKDAPAALLFPTGYMANLAVLSTLPTKGDLLILDKLCHASLIDGARLAGASGAIMRTFPHRRLDLLAERLGEHQRAAPDASRFIVTDSVFSMDGDCADLAALAQLRDRFDAALIIDEAHATGVLGATGAGLDEHHAADITISTASKALGSLGGLVTGPAEILEWLVNSARPFIYTTASSPLLAAAIDAALDIIEREPQRRERLASLCTRARSLLTARGFDAGCDPTPIIPLVVGSVARAAALSAHLAERGILAPAINPPTVAPNSSRVRLSLHCDLTDADLDRFDAALAEFDFQQ